MQILLKLTSVLLKSGLEFMSCIVNVNAAVLWRNVSACVQTLHADALTALDTVRDGGLVAVL